MGDGTERWLSGVYGFTKNLRANRKEPGCRESQEYQAARRPEYTRRTTMTSPATTFEPSDQRPARTIGRKLFVSNIACIVLALVASPLVFGAAAMVLGYRIRRHDPVLGNRMLVASGVALATGWVVSMFMWRAML